MLPDFDKRVLKHVLGKGSAFHYLVDGTIQSRAISMIQLRKGLLLQAYFLGAVSG
jgi:hypothetical protein